MNEDDVKQLIQQIQDKCFKWAQGVMSAPISNVTCVVSTRYSTVFKFECADQLYYLKYVPNDRFMCEADILNIFSGTQAGAFIPEIVSINQDIPCFITEVAGQGSVRAYFKDRGFDADIFKAGLRAYQRIQDHSVAHMDAFFALGVQDWRGEKFVEAYLDMLDSPMLNINRDGKPHAEDLRKTILAIDALGLGHSLSHSDYHDNNMLIDTRDNTVRIIDWGEVVVTSPLFSRFAAIEKSRAFYAAQIGHDVFDDLEGFTCEGIDTEQARGLIKPLLPLYDAMTYYQLIKMVGATAPDKWVDRVRQSLNQYMERT